MVAGGAYMPHNNYFTKTNEKSAARPFLAEPATHTSYGVGGRFSPSCAAPLDAHERAGAGRRWGFALSLGQASSKGAAAGAAGIIITRAHRRRTRARSTNSSG